MPVGLQIYAEATGFNAVSKMLRLEETKPLVLCAMYTPGTGSQPGSFGVDLILPTTDCVSLPSSARISVIGSNIRQINFHCMKSGAITLKVLIAKNLPHIAITADIYIKIANRKDPLTLELALEATEHGASGSAWVFPILY